MTTVVSGDDIEVDEAELEGGRGSAKNARSEKKKERLSFLNCQRSAQIFPDQLSTESS
jgi:hypothetical protein